MKRLLITAGLATALVAVPAQARNAERPGGQPDRVKPQRAAKCKTKTVGFNARGVLVAVNLTQTRGADTPRRGDDRFGGTVEVDVKRANHGVATGVQTFTLTDARVKYHDADGDGTAEQPKAGDVVKVHGKVTKRRGRCTGEFTPVVTVKQVQFKSVPSAG